MQNIHHTNSIKGNKMIHNTESTNNVARPEYWGKLGRKPKKRKFEKKLVDEAENLNLE